MLSYLLNGAPQLSEAGPQFFGFMGCTAALSLACIGSAYGTAKSGVGVAAMGVLRPDMVNKALLPVIMAGVIGIYGLVVAVIMSILIKSSSEYTPFKGFAHLAAGLCAGLACMSAGMCIGIIGDAGVRASAQQDKLYGRVLLMCIFAEALALYGIILAVILAIKVRLFMRYFLTKKKS